MIPKEIINLFQLARKEDASDIHIIANLPPLFRINDELILANTPPLSREETRRLCMELLSDEQRIIFKRDWQISCTIFDDDLGRFRVSVYYHASNPEMAIRPINQDLKTREGLGLPEKIEDLTRYSNGLVLITGPTGSGKTTTLNYMIDLINCERRCKIITIEDPVEYVHTRKKAVVIQQELYSDVKSFSSGLVHVLRQDPDVICIGEMRDYETTATALMAAETGHLVFATCHTPNAVQTVERIVSIFPPEQQQQVITQLANSLQAILAQRLIPSADKKKRILATELLIANSAARNNIREKQFHQLVNVLQMGHSQGMHRMDDSLLKLYEVGDITYDTTINNAYDSEAMRDRVHQ